MICYKCNLNDEPYVSRVVSIIYNFQMGLLNVELYNNLGLSCFYAQQYDMTLACMERALEMANEETLGKDTLIHLIYKHS